MAETVSMSSEVLLDNTETRPSRVKYFDPADVALARTIRYRDVDVAKTDEDQFDPRCRRHRAPLMADNAFPGDETAVIPTSKEGFTIELARWLPGGFVTPHIHPTLEFLMVLEGYGQVIISNEWDKPIDLAPYDCVAIPAGALRSFGNPMTDRDCLMWIAVVDTHRNGVLPADDFEFIRK
ncbi:MAG: cupin domain-containing protein [Caulobacterales bacterium]|nr:cupin domain-containing protein [Caulobacterales bacterium]